jgi:hypothetical protein
VGVQRRPWEASAPQVGIVLEQVPPPPDQTDVGHDDLAAGLAPLDQHMGPLATMEGDGQVGAEGHIAERAAGVAVDPEGVSTATTVEGAARGWPAPARDLALQRPRQARAEQGVDIECRWAKLADSGRTSPFQREAAERAASLDGGYPPRPRPASRGGAGGARRHSRRRRCRRGRTRSPRGRWA